MKKVLAVFLVLSLCAGVWAAEEGKKDTAQGWFDAMAYSFGRGIVNCMTCWLEVPRNIFYQMARNPLYGVIVGSCDGLWLAGARAFGGVTDVCFLGLTGPGIYTESFPDYVWQEGWVPEDAMVMKGM